MILYAFAAVLLVVWIAGFLVFKVTSVLIHVLLALAIAVVVSRFLASRRSRD